jgi:mannosyltransferase OCH1-like enzyme
MRANWGGEDIFGVYQQTLFPVMKADVFRYCVVYDKGGYYVDATKGIFRDLRSFHAKTDSGLISFEKNVSPVPPNLASGKNLLLPEFFVANWAFGFSRHHKILESMIENILVYSSLFQKKIYEHPKTAILSLSATGMFTKTVRDYVEEFGAEDLAQAGTDFDGTGLFRLRGANNPWPPVPHHYSEAKNSPILN